jgi:hypothetical protein
MTTAILAANDVKISGFKYEGQTIPNDVNIAGLLTGGGVNLLNLLFFGVGLVFFFNLLFAAWEYVTSTGNQNQIQAATKRLTNALLGIAIVVSSYIIIRIIGNMIGFGSGTGVDDII